ncbi:hypothetical protein LCGC14_0375180 [marine sediment metagenome]|uniref:Uncharacterized protein n=1 Tax=marine sediment metagenome TaxID=412755 RepID=A0A0F9VR67_9ZZZZ
MSTAAEAEHAPRPWERRPTDTDQMWDGFVRYRDMGSMFGERPGRRSLRLVAEAAGIQLSQAAVWSTEHGWKERCTLYDMHLDSLALETTEKTIREMNKRHARSAMMLQRFAGTEIGKLAAKAEERTHDPVDDAKPADVSRIMETGIKLERLSRGEATERTENSDGLDLSKLDVEELKELKRLKEKASA